MCVHVSTRRFLQKAQIFGKFPDFLIGFREKIFYLISSLSTVFLLYMEV